MTKYLTRPALFHAPELPPVISVEEEFHALDQAHDAHVAIINTIADTDHMAAVHAALSDLAFVTDTIHQTTAGLTPENQALIQISADSAVAGMGIPGDVVVPDLEDMTDVAAVVGHIRQFIEKIIKLVWAAAKHIYERLQVFLVNFHSTMGNARQRFDRTYADYSKMPNRAGTGKVSIPTIHLNGQERNSASEFIAVIRSFLDTLRLYMDQARDFEATFQECMSKFFTETLQQTFQTDHMLTALQPVIAKSRLKSRLTPNKGDEDSLEIVNDDRAGFHVWQCESDEIYGAYIFHRGICQEVGDFKDDPHMIARVIKTLSRHAVFKLNHAHDESASPMMEIEPLSKSEVKEVLNLAEVLLKHISFANNNDYLCGATGTRARQAQQVIKSITRGLKSYEGSPTVRRELVEASTDVCHHLTEQSSVIYVRLMQITLKAYNACLHYANKSIQVAGN